MIGLKKPRRRVAGVNRFGKPLIFLDAYFHRKVSSQDSDGDLCIYEVVRTKRSVTIKIRTNGSSFAKENFYFKWETTIFASYPATRYSRGEKCRTPSLTSAREACLRSSITLPARWKNSFAKAVDCCCATRHPMNGKHSAAFTE
jgi:hypothetical protein